MVKIMKMYLFVSVIVVALLVLYTFKNEGSYKQDYIGLILTTIEEVENDIDRLSIAVSKEDSIILLSDIKTKSFFVAKLTVYIGKNESDIIYIGDLFGEIGNSIEDMTFNVNSIEEKERELTEIKNALVYEVDREEYFKDLKDRISKIRSEEGNSILVRMHELY